MASAEMSIDGVVIPGDDLTIFSIRGFSLGGDLKTFVVTRAVDSLSAQIVLLKTMEQVRDGLLRCLDDGGAEYLAFKFAGAKVTDYSVGAGPERAIEQFSLACFGLEMKTGSSEVSIM